MVMANTTKTTKPNSASPPTKVSVMSRLSLRANAPSLGHLLWPPGLVIAGRLGALAAAELVPVRPVSVWRAGQIRHVLLEPGALRPRPQGRLVGRMMEPSVPFGRHLGGL